MEWQSKLARTGRLWMRPADMTAKTGQRGGTVPKKAGWLPDRPGTRDLTKVDPDHVPFIVVTARVDGQGYNGALKCFHTKSWMITE